MTLTPTYLTSFVTTPITYQLIAPHQTKMPDPSLTGIKALTFDVFGTVVDWRPHIINTLRTLAPPSAKHVDWADFAQQWRLSHGQFCGSYQPSPSPSSQPFKTSDDHHRESLPTILSDFNLPPTTFTPEQVEQLVQTWHELTPWPDSPAGIAKLKQRFKTAMLSDGNRSCLVDLDKNGNLGYDEIFSSEDFKAYKPHPTVYLGACQRLGLQPTEVAMVAAHLGDLAAAHKLGFKTVYVERPREERWDVTSDRYTRAKEWVDLWVGLDDVEGGLKALEQGRGGLVEVAKRLVGEE
ncbi:HAD-like domain-containing protein [Triangularia verruculosa]|uniref:HAD-like domain-containing protein n=1 Tax=Triangularia verruculosa TaxID=2587418 RepID=A0AAN7AVB5_9PEZI|nr:HAD-like domain-containing protein [Triangularia verruculosa]